MWTLDPWSIEEALFDWVVSNVPKGSTIVELGSGEGTQKLIDAGYKIFSIEEKQSFLRLVPDTNYIYAPYKNKWYDPDCITGKLPKEYTLLLVDGPCTEDRPLMANFTDLFNFNTTIIFDDYEQGQVKDLIGRLAPVLKREGTMYQGKTKQFYVVKAV